jgi:uncharacterized membrane protein
MRPAIRVLRRWPGLPVVALFMLALAVRLLRLTYHSLWFDEAVSVFWAGQPLGRIWSVGMSLVEDKHPPLYHLLLHVWISLFGDSDGAVRSLGSLLGAAAVLPIIGIGQLLGSRSAGVVAGLLAALNPFLVWYSQEVRMFMPATAIGLAGLYGLLRAWQCCSDARREGLQARPTRCAGWLLVALVGLVCACYTYLFGLFFVVVAGVWLLALLLVTGPVRALRRPWKGFLVCAAMIAVSAALVAPLLWSAWQVNQAESVPGRAFQHFGGAIRNLLTAFSVHSGPWSDCISRSAWVVAAVMACIGMTVPLGQRTESRGLGIAGRPCLAAFLLTPLLLGGVLLSRDRSLFDEPRYFIMLVPGLCLLWGRALAMTIDRFKWVGAGLLTATLGMAIISLSHVWLPQNLREDWRTVAQYVETHAGSNDAVLVHVDYVHVAFDRYFGGPQPVFFPFGSRVQGSSEIDAPLTGLLAFDSVWLVQSHTEQVDPDHLVEHWFADRFPLATEQYPAGVTIKRFITRYRLPALPGDASGVWVELGPDIYLAGCSVVELATPATDERSHPPSAWVHVTLDWSAQATPSVDYSSSVRMIDRQGQVWGDKLQRAQETLRVWPTSRWEPGEIVREEVDVNLNPLTPAGYYRIVVGLLDPSGGPLGGEFSCAEVQVVPERR